jgi:hypothetical protein
MANEYHRANRARWEAAPMHELPEYLLIVARKETGAAEAG